MAHWGGAGTTGSALHFKGDGVGVAVRDEFPERQSPLNLQETIPGSYRPKSMNRSVAATAVESLNQPN